MNILLTTSGRRGYLVEYFKEALQEFDGLIHASSSEWSSALQSADKFVITPLIYDDNYVNFILNYCKKNDISAIVPLFDIDLPVLAKAKPLFENNGIRIIVPDLKVVQICNDKWESFIFFEKHKINTPKTFLFLDDAKTALKKGEIFFPLVIKPRWGMGSMHFFTANNLEELEILYPKVKEEIKNSYLKYESNIDINNSVLVQEKIIAQEYGLDVINDLDNNYITTFVKEKIAMRSGETDRAITRKNNRLEELGRTISKNLGHNASLDVDCLVSGDDIFVLEMNCRFGGGYPFSHLAGANIPMAIIYWLKGEQAPKNLFEIKYNIEGFKNICPIIRKTDKKEIKNN